MKLTDFRYEIEGLNIPDTPLEQRDEARLMVLNRAEQTIEHKKFSDIHEYLNEGDVIVYNNTKVFPARLNGKKEKLHIFNIDTHIIDDSWSVRFFQNIFEG